MISILKELCNRKLVAIVRGIPSADIVKLGEALLAGGISCIEVTFNQASDNQRETLDSISALTREFGEKLFVGAGTVMSPEQVAAARDAGATYIISPDTNVAVIEATKSLGLCSLPGALTPTEIAAAFNAGADLVKLFPVSQFGPAYIKAVKGPLAHIPLVAVGGVSPQNLGDFIKAGATGAGIGGNLVSPKLIGEGRFPEITALAKEYTDALAAAL